MSRKRDSFLSLPTKKWKKRLGLGVDEDEIQTKVLKATADNHANIDLADFSQVVQLTSAGPGNTQKALQAIHGVILCNEWKVAFKGLQLLDYLLHYGSEEVLPWVNKHIASLQALVWDLYDQDHKGVLLGHLKVIRSLVEDGERLENERSDPLQRWLDRATRSPPLPAPPTINAAIAPPRSTQNLPRREISPSNFHNQITPKGPSPNNQDYPSPNISKTLFTMKEELHKNQGDARGVLAEANVSPTKENDGSMNAQMKDDLVPILNRGNHPGDPHRNIVRILTLQAIHMLLACQSIMEFLRLNGNKMKFSRERDTQLWNSYLSRISTDGVQDLDFYRNRLIGYSQDLEKIPSEHMNRLGGPVLKRSIKEMQKLSFSLENFVKFGERYIFTDDASRPVFHRLFIEPGRGAFEYVAQWEEEITEIAARNDDSIMGAMNQIESEDLIFRRQHLIFAYQMREIATQFIEFAKESEPRSQLKPLGLDSLNVIEPSHGLSFLTPSQDSEYKSMFVAITGEGSQVISKEQTTEAIKTTDIHPQSVAHIWEAVADVTSSDELYFPEFALAMYLGNELCEGRSIKLKLPPKMKQEIAHNVRLIKTNIALDIANIWATKYRQKMEMTQEQSESLIPPSKSVSTNPPTSSVSSSQTSYNQLHKVLLPKTGDSTEPVSRSTDEAGKDTTVKSREKTEAMLKTMKHNIASKITKSWAERYLQQADIAQEQYSGPLLPDFDFASIDVPNLEHEESGENQYRQTEETEETVIQHTDIFEGLGAKIPITDSQIHYEHDRDEEVNRDCICQSEDEGVQVLTQESVPKDVPHEPNSRRAEIENQKVIQRESNDLSGDMSHTKSHIPAESGRRGSPKRIWVRRRSETETPSEEASGPERETEDTELGHRREESLTVVEILTQLSVGKDPENQEEVQVLEKVVKDEDKNEPVNRDLNDLTQVSILYHPNANHRQHLEAEEESRLRDFEKKTQQEPGAKQPEAEEQRQRASVKQQRPEAEERRQPKDDEKIDRDIEVQRQSGLEEQERGYHGHSGAETALVTLNYRPRSVQDSATYSVESVFGRENLQVVEASPRVHDTVVLEKHEQFESQRRFASEDEESRGISTHGNLGRDETQVPEHRGPESVGQPHDRYGTASPQLKIQRHSTPNSDLSSMSSSRVVSDLVRDSKLETVFAPNGRAVRHVSYVTNPRMRRRRVRKEEVWERLQELGSGAFGRVWLEKCTTGEDTGKLRAVKEITKIQHQNKNREIREIDYNRELEAIAKFSHRKYVHCFVHSFGWYESEQVIFIAMEYMEQGDLQSHLVRSFPEDEVRDIVFQLLEGLSFMHDNGFAHRDLKPANILVSEPSPSWWVKIGDFGISKRAEEEATAFRTLVGTRGYVAPEVIGIYCPEDIDTLLDSSNLYTVAVDLWALGAIMFKLLTNQTVFSEPRELARYITGKRPFPRSLPSEQGASESCLKFLEEVMAHSPASRPSSSQALAHEWLADLSNATDSEGEFPDQMSISTGVSTEPSTVGSTGAFTPAAGNSTASAAWPSTFS